MNYLFKFHPSLLAFVSASEDKSARLFDLRADQQIANYQTPGTATSFTCVVLSKSGRYMIAGSDDSSIHIFDVLKTSHLGNKHKVSNFLHEVRVQNVFLFPCLLINQISTVFIGNLAGHENRITSLAITDSGLGLASSSWDQHVRVWV